MTDDLAWLLGTANPLKRARERFEDLVSESTPADIMEELCVTLAQLQAKKQEVLARRIAK